MLLLGGLSPSTFLRKHWQKEPLLVRGAFPKFRDPITPEELAGLSCEDGVESRIVRQRGKKWDVTWGPQDEAIFAKLPETQWTILVQELNRWVPESALLLDSFDFIPNVRVDDVMVSYAAVGGSVGAHLDSYDVFLIQGQGKRRWRYDTRPTKEKDFVAGLDLRILAKFEPDADHVLEPGDMLYLPPGFAHHGIAVTPCLTYSIGFRSPSAAEAWTSFAAERAASPGASRLLEDPPLDPATNGGEIPPKLLARVRELVRSINLSDDDAIDHWFASFATRLKPGHSLESPARRPTREAIEKRLAKNAVVKRSEEGRWAFLPNKKTKSVILYVGGVAIDVPKDAIALVELLCSKRRHAGQELQKKTRSNASRALLVQLFEIGALGF